MSNPLSAITLFSKLNSPHCWTRSTSDTEPSYKWLMYTIVPSGDIPTRIFKCVMVRIGRPSHTQPWWRLNEKLGCINDHPSWMVPLFEAGWHPFVCFWLRHPHRQLLEFDVHQIDLCCKDLTDGWGIHIKTVCKVYIQSQSQSNHYHEELLL